MILPPQEHRPCEPTADARNQNLTAQNGSNIEQEPWMFSGFVSASSSYTYPHRRRKYIRGTANLYLGASSLALVLCACLLHSYQTWDMGRPRRSKTSPTNTQQRVTTKECATTLPNIDEHNVLTWAQVDPAHRPSIRHQSSMPNENELRALGHLKMNCRTTSSSWLNSVPAFTAASALLCFYAPYHLFMVESLHFDPWIGLSNIDVKVSYLEPSDSDINLTSCMCFLFLNTASSLIQCLEDLPVEGQFRRRVAAATPHVSLKRPGETPFRERHLQGEPSMRVV